ncbi:MAG: alternative ribosome rescue aminoacyl-tRNA hydrolase ArfB [Bacteroidota bacterium]
MKSEELRNRIPVSDIRFSTTRSSGPGGQNVNKVNTRVELRFNVHASNAFSTEEKERILHKLKNKISNTGDLIITCQSERSQLMNRKKAEEKLFKLLASALTEKRKRKPTKPTEASKKKRLENKNQRGEIKKLRKVSGADE